MTESLKNLMTATKMDRAEGLEPITLHISSPAQEMIRQAAEELNISWDLALELLLNYGSTPLYNDLYK